MNLVALLNMDYYTSLQTNNKKKNSGAIHVTFKKCLHFKDKEFQ